MTLTVSGAVFIECPECSGKNVYSQVVGKITFEKSGAVLREAGLAARFFMSLDESAIP